MMANPMRLNVVYCEQCQEGIKYRLEQRLSALNGPLITRFGGHVIVLNPN